MRQKQLLGSSASDPPKVEQRRSFSHTRQQYLFERVDHLAALPRVRKIPKTPQKNNRFAVRRRPRNRLHRALRKSNQEDHDRFSTSAVCHALLHPITLGKVIYPLEE